MPAMSAGSMPTEAAVAEWVIAIASVALSPRSSFSALSAILPCHVLRMLPDCGLKIEPKRLVFVVVNLVLVVRVVLF